MPNNMTLAAASIAAAMAMTGVAGAADIASAPAGHDWSGFYIGAHVGYGEAYYDGYWDGSSDDYDPSDLDLAGIAGGLHAGFNHQMDALVLGVEGDFTFTDWSDSQTKSAGYEVISGKVKSLASLRGRLGIASDDVLLYGTGGIAVADASYKQVYGVDSQTWDFNKIGGVVGAGAEWAMTDDFSLRAEGLYYFFNDRHDTSGFIGSFDANDHVEFNDAYMIRLGGSFYFR